MACMKPQTFKYGEVEGILARLHGADADAQAGALRGRIKHLRRLGMPFGQSPGTGNKIEYGSAEIYQFAFCLELEEFGLDPALIVGLLEAHRAYVLSCYAGAEKKLAADGGDYYFFLFTEFMAASWSKERLKFPGLPEIGAGPIERIEMLVPSLGSLHRRRFAIFNMTPCIKAVLAAVREVADVSS
jgi:hypothetical protein